MAVEAKAVFAALDADGDGTLSCAELSSRLSDFGLGDEEIAELFLRLDTNGDGKIDSEEWLAGYGRYHAATAGNGSAALSHSALESRSLEAELLEALVEARARPDLVAERVRERLGWLKGKEMTRPGRAVPLVTKEGAAAVNDALAFLAKQPAQVGFCSEAVEGLALACADHISDVGSVGEASHSGSDGSTFSERQRRYGQWKGKCGECLWYGKTGSHLSGRDMVDDLIVDDGVPTRGHRLCIYDPAYSCAAVSVGAHAVYSNMACIEFSGGYEPDAAAISRRQADGPPKIENKGGPTSVAFHKIGSCVGCGEQIRGGSVVEIPALGKFHSGCFCCGSCNKPLAGDKTKKQEQKRVFCGECWRKEFAETCAHCSKPIEGAKTKAGGGVYHPPCWSKVKAAGGSAGAKPKRKGGRASKGASKGAAVSVSMGGAKNAMDGLAGDYANLM